MLISSLTKACLNIEKCDYLITTHTVIIFIIIIIIITIIGDALNPQVL